MSTILRLSRETKGIRAQNAAGTVDLLLDHDHIVGKLFGTERDVVYAKCKVANGIVELCNPVKAKAYLETVKENQRGR